MWPTTMPPTISQSLWKKTFRRPSASRSEVWRYVNVATGHFSVLNMPSFPGIEKFPGWFLPSHAFRNSSHFKDMNVLMEGSSISAEDIALRCLSEVWRQKHRLHLANKAHGFPVALSGNRKTTADQDRRQHHPFSKTVPQQKWTTSFCARGVIIPSFFWRTICAWRPCLACTPWDSTRAFAASLREQQAPLNGNPGWITPQESFPSQTRKPRTVTARNGLPDNDLFS